MRESDFQRNVIKELKDRFPGCIILKNDASYKQGVPDLIILFEDQWATLECKNCRAAHHQANQDYWVDIMDDMSFSEFIYPENMDRVFDRLDDFFCLNKDF